MPPFEGESIWDELNWASLREDPALSPEDFYRIEAGRGSFPDGRGAMIHYDAGTLTPEMLGEGSVHGPPYRSPGADFHNWTSTSDFEPYRFEPTRPHRARFPVRRYMDPPSPLEYLLEDLGGGPAVVDPLAPSMDVSPPAPFLSSTRERVRPAESSVAPRGRMRVGPGRGLHHYPLGGPSESYPVQRLAREALEAEMGALSREISRLIQMPQEEIRLGYGQGSPDVMDWYSNHSEAVRDASAKYTNLRRMLNEMDRGVARVPVPTYEPPVPPTSAELINNVAGARAAEAGAPAMTAMERFLAHPATRLGLRGLDAIDAVQAATDATEGLTAGREAQMGFQRDMAADPRAAWGSLRSNLDPTGNDVGNPIGWLGRNFGAAIEQELTPKRWPDGTVSRGLFAPAIDVAGRAYDALLDPAVDLWSAIGRTLQPTPGGPRLPSEDAVVPSGRRSYLY